MTLYTSNFSKVKDIPHYSISVSKPKWDNSISVIKELAPDWYWVNEWNVVKDLPEDNPTKLTVKDLFIKAYLQKIKDIDFSSILKDGMVLCCWCASGKFCHRLVLAEYLRTLGYDVKEI